MARRYLTSKRSMDIADLALSGHPPRVIAEKLGTTRNCIKATLSQLRALGLEIPRFKPPGAPKGTPFPAHTRRPKLTKQPAKAKPSA